MKNLIKKNQLMITALALLIAIAGYLQFASKNPDSAEKSGSDLLAKEVSATDKNQVVNENYIADGILDLSEEDLTWTQGGDILSLDSETEKLFVEDYPSLKEGADSLALTEQMKGTPAEGEVPGEAVFTSTTGSSLLADAKLIKEQIRAKNKETLMEIINSDALTDIQKQTAVDCMVQMTEIAEKEAAAEILLEAKGFQDIVVSMNGDTVDVVVNAVVLDDIKRAQIEDIVKRKTNIEPKNIIISPVVQ